MERSQFLDHYKQSANDITGWQYFIFLPFDLYWQFIIVLVSLYSFIRGVYYAFFDIVLGYLAIVGYIIDVFYFVDVIAASLHSFMVKTRKRRKYKPRKWYFLLADIISLVPFELAYQTLFVQREYHWEGVKNLLFVNKTLRIYRVYTYFSELKPKIKKRYLLIIASYFEIGIYHFLSSHLFTCIWYGLGTPEEKSECHQNSFWCILDAEINMFRVTTHQFGGNRSLINTYGRRIVILVAMLAGYVVLYGLMVPLLIFTFIKFLRPLFEVSNRLRRLRKFAGNMIDTKELREKTVKHFKAVWTYGRGEEEPEIMRQFPLALRKDISVDIHWEALRHSDVFRDVSNGCKRTMALAMKTDFIVPGTQLEAIGDKKRRMIYIASGVLQIMAEENTSSPVMSFSSGTVVGEVGIFLSLKNKAILRSATFSQLQVLEAKDLFRILSDFPKDKLIIFKKLSTRYEIAKLMRLRKHPIYQDLKVINDELSGLNLEDEDHVKWVKRQCRAISSLQMRDGVIFRSHRDTTPSEIPKTNIDHTSRYLELLSISENVEVEQDVVCLKTSLPWVIDPDTHFLRLWKNIILLIAFATCISYPYFIGWYPFFPDLFFDLTVIVTILYILDVIVELSTAVKTQEVVITNIFDMFTRRLLAFHFYADVIAALPLHIIYHLALDKSDQEPFALNLYLTPSLVKVYRISSFFINMIQHAQVGIVVMIMLKYLFFLSLVIWWSAVILELTGVKCIFVDCDPKDWYGQIPDQNDKSVASICFAISLGTATPPRDFDTTTPFSSILVFVLIAFFLFLIMTWHGEYIAGFVLEKSNELKFKGLIENVLDFTRERRISPRIGKRVLDMMKFQWYYDYGDYFTQERSMLDDAPLFLQQEIDQDTVIKTLRKCDFVMGESDSFIQDLSTRGRRVAFPAGSVICTYGNQTMKIFLVHKGYCQMNSFLANDVKSGIGAPILSGPGKIFPVIVAFNQIPSAVTVWTLTDCELVVLSLEDVIETMIQHEMFKDVVEALKSTDFSAILDAKLALTQKIDTSQRSDDSYKEFFNKYKCIGPFLRVFLLKKAIDYEKKGYKRWELSRVIFLCFSLIFWPIIHGLYMYPEKIYILHVLFLLDILAWIDIYIRMNVAYYNRNGVYVTHTLRTLVHYLKSSFITDVIASPAFHHVYRFYNYGFNTEEVIVRTNRTFVIIHLAMRMAGLYRIYGYISYHEGFSRSAHRFTFLKYLLIIVVFINNMVNVLLLFDVNWIYLEEENRFKFDMYPDSWMQSSPISGLSEPTEVYLIILYATIVLLFRNEFFFVTWTKETVVVEAVLGLVGWILIKLIFALFTSNFTSSNLNFTVYQDRMTSFLDFLYSEKADDFIINEAVEHFEYEWAKMKGENLQEVFLKFPDVLHEDLTHSLYINTIRAVHCLSNANPAFYRQLSRNLTEIHFRKGSMLTFENLVQNKIYFLHSGKCLVYRTSVLLLKGSMIGDICLRGIMKNDIYAITHIHCLTISSDLFYEILNNFYETEEAFIKTTYDVEDYIESRYKNLKTEKVHETSAGFKMRGSIDVEESQFIELGAERDSLTGKEAPLLQSTFKYKTFLHPDSKILGILRTVLLLDAFLTVSLLPFFLTLRSFPIGALAFFYFLDFVWLLKIVRTLRTGYYDEETGDLITDSKAMAVRYLIRWDGLITDVLCSIPLEVIPIIHGKIRNEPVNYYDSIYLSLFRFLRIIYLIRFIARQTRKLSVSYYYRWMVIFGIQFLLINSLVVVYILLADHELVYIPGIHWTWEDKHTEALLWSYLHVVRDEQEAF